jgi:hypothetical protein
MQKVIPAILCFVILAVGTEGKAQVKEVSVPYLKAAIGSIGNRSRVKVKGNYDGALGLAEATGRYLRSKGYSRFSVSDMEGRARFESFYCHQDSKAFKSLIDVSGKVPFILYGYKERGEDGEDAIVVTHVTKIREPAASEEDESGAVEGVAEAETKRTYRITMMDAANSNRTALVNVELGKSYNLLGTVLVIEQEEIQLQGGIQPGADQ